MTHMTCRKENNANDTIWARQSPLHIALGTSRFFRCDENQPISIQLANVCSWSIFSEDLSTLNLLLWTRCRKNLRDWTGGWPPSHLLWSLPLVSFWPNQANQGIHHYPREASQCTETIKFPSWLLLSNVSLCSCKFSCCFRSSLSFFFIASTSWKNTRRWES